MTFYRFWLFCVTVLVFTIGRVENTRAEEMMIKSFCQQVAAYHETGEADYVPGVDVHGNPVSSADLSMIEVPIVDPVGINFEVDLRDYFDLSDVIPEGAEMKPSFLDLEIHQDGKILYNGYDITDPINAKCGDETVSNVDGQGVKDAVNSATEKQPVPKAKPEQEIEVEVLEGQYP